MVTTRGPLAALSKIEMLGTRVPRKMAASFFSVLLSVWKYKYQPQSDPNVVTLFSFWLSVLGTLTSTRSSLRTTSFLSRLQL